MFKSHEKFHSANGKRQILIADDELINRELLGHILEEDYELLYAGDGLVAKGVEDSIANFGRLAREGMRETDQEIILMMTEQ